MILRRLTTALFVTALAGALVAPAAAEQVFENISTGRVAPLPTPTGAPLYSDYFSPCYQGSGWSGRRSRIPLRRSNSSTGTVNGERFYPYDPRSQSGSNRNAFNCWNGSGWRPRPRPSLRPYPPRIPLRSPRPQE